MKTEDHDHESNRSVILQPLPMCLSGIIVDQIILRTATINWLCLPDQSPWLTVAMPNAKSVKIKRTKRTISRKAQLVKLVIALLAQ
jgi:hypothetical protein